MHAQHGQPNSDCMRRAAKVAVKGQGIVAQALAMQYSS